MPQLLNDEVKRVLIQFPFYKDFVEGRISDEEAIDAIRHNRSELLKHLDGLQLAAVKGWINATSRYNKFLSDIPVAMINSAFLLCSQEKDAVRVVILNIFDDAMKYSSLAPLIAQLLVDTVESRFSIGFGSPDYLFCCLKQMDPALAAKIAPTLLASQDNVLITVVISFISHNNFKKLAPDIFDVLLRSLNEIHLQTVDIYCIDALAELQHTPALPLFRRLLENCLIENNPIHTHMRAKRLIIALAKLYDTVSLPLIAKYLDSADPELRAYACHCLGYLYGIAYIEKIQSISKDDPDPMVRKFALKALKYIKSAQEGRHDVSKHLLYVDQPETFFEPGFPKREHFEKTGSETILLGGAQAGKAIVRVVDDIAFKAWLQALSSDIWKKYGFDYVPVEPILRRWDGSLRVKKVPSMSMPAADFPKKPRSAFSYRVFTKVLGPPLALFIGKHPEYRDVLKKYADIIKMVLKKIGIEHGHTHDFNFCVDTSKGKPRLYVIDFDQAEREMESPLPPLSRPVIEELPKEKITFLDKVKKLLRAG